MSMEDYAQEIELAAWARNNASRPDPVKYAPGDAGYGPEDCDECGATMPAARRAHGFTICVECRTKQEVREKHLRR